MVSVYFDNLKNNWNIFKNIIPFYKNMIKKSLNMDLKYMDIVSYEFLFSDTGFSVPSVGNGAVS